MFECSGLEACHLYQNGRMGNELLWRSFRKPLRYGLESNEQIVTSANTSTYFNDFYTSVVVILQGSQQTGRKLCNFRVFTECKSRYAFSCSSWALSAIHHKEEKKKHTCPPLEIHQLSSRLQVHACQPPPG